MNKKYFNLTDPSCYFNIQIYFIVAIAWISMKISLPALVELEAQFCVSEKFMKLSIVFFFIFYGMSTLFWGLL